MPLIFNIIVSLLVSYLIGAIPTAYWAGRLCKGIDIRMYGSGNVGATNAFRVLGKGPGLVVFVVDIIKGIIPTVIVADVLGLEGTLLRVILGMTAVIGHNWTVFLNFKGGKGIATSLGLMIGLAIKIEVMRLILMACLLVWGGVFWATGYVSLSSLLTASVLPILMVISNQPFELILLGAGICFFVFLRHRSNIKRLLNGQEPKLDLFKKR